MSLWKQRLRRVFIAFYKHITAKTTIQPSWLANSFVEEYKSPDEYAISVNKDPWDLHCFIKLIVICDFYDLDKTKTNHEFLKQVWLSAIEDLMPCNAVAKILNDCNKNNRFIEWDGKTEFFPERDGCTPFEGSKTFYTTIDGFMRYYVKERVESQELCNFFDVLAEKLVQHNHYTSFLNMYMTEKMGVIDKLEPEPVLCISSKGDCAICYAEDVPLIPICMRSGHAFCMTCLPRISKTECPSCRGSAVILDIDSMCATTLANQAYWMRKCKKLQDKLKESQDDLVKCQDKCKEQESAHNTLKRKLCDIILD